jgi:hypothetical protein
MTAVLQTALLFREALGRAFRTPPGSSDAHPLVLIART